MKGRLYFEPEIRNSMALESIVKEKYGPGKTVKEKYGPGKTVKPVLDKNPASPQSISRTELLNTHFLSALENVMDIANTDQDRVGNAMYPMGKCFDDLLKNIESGSAARSSVQQTIGNIQEHAQSPVARRTLHEGKTLSDQLSGLSSALKQSVEKVTKLEKEIDRSPSV